MLSSYIRSSLVRTRARAFLTFAIYQPGINLRVEIKKGNRLTAGDVISGDARLRLIFAEDSTELGVIVREEVNGCFPVLVFYSLKEKV